MRHSPVYLLGYIPAHNKFYFVDKDVNVYAHGPSLAVVEYQAAVLRGDMDTESELLADVPPSTRWKPCCPSLSSILRQRTNQVESSRQSYAVRVLSKPLYELAFGVGAMVSTNAVKEVDCLAHGEGLNNIALRAELADGGCAECRGFAR